MGFFCQEKRRSCPRPREVLTLKAADTLHNIRSILEDLRLKGDAVWERFRAGREEQVWYYTSVAQGIAERLGEEGLAGELAGAAEELVKRAEAARMIAKRLLDHAAE